MVSAGVAGALGGRALALTSRMDRQPPDGCAYRAFEEVDGPAAVLFDPERTRQPFPGMFEAEHWGTAAVPVSAGGRGAAWFIETGDARWVLRRYRRGGLAARISTARYLWLGESATRSFAEFRLLRHLAGLGLPVPVPVAAYYSRRGISYCAALLMERLPDATPLADRLGAGVPADIWASVGRTLADFHRAGVDHADLNANNILVSKAGRVSVIDFDRSRLRAVPGRWQEGNMARLRRSLEKIGGVQTDAPWRSGWLALRAAYDAAMVAP